MLIMEKWIEVDGLNLMWIIRSSCRYARIAAMLLAPGYRVREGESIELHSGMN
jgi:hypothetical protein